MNDNEKATKWETDSLIYIVKDSDNLDTLEKEFEEYRSQTNEKQRISDSKSIEIYGLDNATRYNNMKSSFLKSNIKDPEVQNGSDVIKTEDMHYPNLTIDVIRSAYVPNAIQLAEDWCFGGMYYLVIPYNNFDKVQDTWIKYNSQTYKRQRLCDAKSIELFGVDNRTHYDCLKSAYLKKDIDTSNDTNVVTADDAIAHTSTVENLVMGLKKSDSIPQSVQYIMELSNTPVNGVYEELIAKKAIVDKIKYFRADTCNVFDSEIIGDDLPFFYPDEMIDFGVFAGEGNKYSATPDNTNIEDGVTVKQWFEEYKSLMTGIQIENRTDKWINKLRGLYSSYDMIKESGDIARINSRKQSILELGWNPEVDFNIENRVNASRRIHDIIGSKYKRIPDISSFVEANTGLSTTTNSIITSYKDGNENDLLPVFIVLVSGRSLFSAAIKSFDHGPFSHATISFDPGLHYMYSYNIKPNANGFVKEDIKEYHPDTEIIVYGIFVKRKDFNKMMEKIDYYKLNQLKTTYGTKNLLGYVTHKEIKSVDFSMVCSQFVDSILKLANIDLSNKPSALTSPNDYFRAGAYNDRIYLLYKGKCSSYNQSKIERYLHATTPVPIKESAEKIILEESFIHNIGYTRAIANSQFQKQIHEVVYNNLIKDYVCIKEVKDLPIEFDQAGNLLIKKIGSIDYENEYRKSHKMLGLYSKTKNIDGMKYELAKLWFLNSVIEKEKTKTKELSDTRARILGDFHRYLALVLEEDTNFVFTTYYNDTPFSDATIRIKGSTIKHVINLTKTLLL